MLNTGLVYSQTAGNNKNQLKIESGYAFTGSGDLNGYCIYNEYSRILGERFKIAPSIGFLNFSNSDYSDIDLLENVDCISLDLTGYYIPFKRDRFNIEIGLGTYFRNWNWIYATGPDVYFSSLRLRLDPSSHAELKTKSVGYIISIGTGINISEIIGLSFRGVYQNDLNSDNSLTARVGFNIKF